MEFIPGIALSRRYHDEAVAPVLARRFPDLAYSSALIGYGSEVLGFDDPMSSDHNWGPRLLLFVARQDLAGRGEHILQALEHEIRDQFLGWPTRVAIHDPSAPDADPHGRRPARLLIEVHALSDWLVDWLGLDPAADWSWGDWLGLPEQRLLEVTGGGVFRDDDGALTRVRERLARFPRDVWLYKLACQWIRIAEVQAFVGRAADSGDALGERLIAARLAEDVMRLCFLIEQRYAPYPKWFGRAFSQLPSAARIGPLLEQALRAEDRRAREQSIAEACRLAALRHLELGVPGRLEPRITTYAELVRAAGDPNLRGGAAPERDFTVINAEEIAAAIRMEIADPEVAGLAPVGAIDQFCDSAEVLEQPGRAHRIAAAAAVSARERGG